MFTFKNGIIAIVAIAVLAVGINAFAYGGKGRGSGWGHHRGGMNYQGDRGCGYGDSMSPEASAQFEQKREAFFNETRDLRNSLFEKERELQGEMAQAEPDAAKASQLQRELSDLQSQYDQMRIDHMLEMRKLNPNAGRGFRSGGRMKGYGAKRGGNCW